MWQIGWGEKPCWSSSLWVVFFFNCVLLKQPIDDSMSDNSFQMLLLPPDFSYCPHHNDFHEGLYATDLAEKTACSLQEHTETEKKRNKSSTKSQCQKRHYIVGDRMRLKFLVSVQWIFLYMEKLTSQFCLHRKNWGSLDTSCFRMEATKLKHK